MLHGDRLTTARGAADAPGAVALNEAGVAAYAAAALQLCMADSGALVAPGDLALGALAQNA